MADLPIGAAIAKVRESRGLSQRQVADRAGFQRTYVSKIENGRAQPQVDSLVLFADAMRIEPWRLLRFACRLKDQLERKDAA